VPPQPGNAIDACPAGAFCRLAGTKLTDLPLPTRPPGNRAYITAYSGAAYDDKSQSLVIGASGGHNDYGGNEVVAFSTTTVSWRLLGPPSIQIPVQGTACSSYGNTYADGKPASRHTYGGLTWLPKQDALLLLGGLKWCAAGDAVRPVDAWWFVPALGVWMAKSLPPLSSAVIKSAYDPVTDTVFANCGDGSCGLTQYAPAANTWTTPKGSSSYGAVSMALDPKRRLAVYLGSSGIVTQELATGAKTTRVLTGDALPSSAATGGLAYDPPSDRLLVWAGGLVLYEVNLDTNVSRKIIATGTSPGPASDAGTYGRWAYASSKDAYLLVLSGATEVFTYKPLRAVQPPVPPDPIPPTPGGIVPGTFYDLAPPSWGGPAAGSKHVSFTFHPPTNRVVSQGGDFQDSRQPTADSYRQEMYAFDFAARWADRGNRDAGWTLLQPYCPTSTAGIQPKSPDFIGWVWDPARAGFWLVPGTTVVPVYAVCPGRTVSEHSDAQFVWRRVMFWNGTWTDKADPGLTISDNWQSVLDPQRDLIVRFGHTGGSGGVADILDLKTLVWRRKNLETSATGNVRLNTAGLAVDLVGRRIYGIDPFSGKLFRYNMDTEVVDNLGVYPGGPYTASVDAWSYSVWDSANRVIINWRNELPTKLYVFDPSTGLWTTPAWITEPAGGAPTVTHAMVYDPANRVVLFLGAGPSTVGPKRAWAYRYK
jgi:hypothetical protein